MLAVLGSLHSFDVQKIAQTSAVLSTTHRLVYLMSFSKYAVVPHCSTASTGSKGSGLRNASKRLEKRLGGPSTIL